MPIIGSQLENNVVIVNLTHMKKTSSGFTLIELLVVVAIAAVLISLAVPSFTSMLMRRSVQSTALTLVSDLRYARTEALRRSARVSICSLANNSTSVCSGSPARWVNGWMIFVDTGATTGVVDVGEEIIRVQQAPENILSIQRDTTPTNTRNVLTFESNGFARTADETLVVIPTQSASATVNRVICISRGGRPALRVEGATGC